MEFDEDLRQIHNGTMARQMSRDDFREFVDNLMQENDIQRKNAILAYAFLKAEQDGTGRFLPSFLAYEGKNEEAANAVKRYGTEYIESNYGPMNDSSSVTFNN